jgi:outer membrane protein assembly factor BamD
MFERIATAPWRRPAALLLVTALLAACAGGPPEDPNSQAGLDKLYSEAKDDLSVGSYEPAIKKLERVEARAAGTLLAQQAMLEKAWAQFRSGEKAAAIVTLDRFLKLHPSSAGVEYAMYLKGLVNFNENLGLFGRLAGQDVAERDQQASKDALLAFRDLVERFPQSRYAADARTRIDFITNTLARHEVAVARYYLARGAHVAAANRAQVALTDYPYAPAAEEALVILGQAYAQLGLNDLAADSRRVLEKNFPRNSTLLPGAASRPWWKLW